ncbi:MAG: hypothetical protein KDD45_15660 [Bdellovibrionales bacterium]|nr:hypothetical protein [Bdellovibrionales bacterium]
MKKTILISLFFFAQISSAIGTVQVSNAEAMHVFQSLNQPQNQTGFFLKILLENNKSQPKIRVLRYPNSNSYSLELELTNDKSTEGSFILVEEVLVSNGKSYVFSFKTERSLLMKKYR